MFCVFCDNEPVVIKPFLSAAPSAVPFNVNEPDILTEPVVLNEPDIPNEPVILVLPLLSILKAFLLPAGPVPVPTTNTVSCELS
jgi:hypothetical protein